MEEGNFFQGTLDPLSLSWLICFLFSTKNYNFRIMKIFVFTSKTMEENICLLAPRQSSRSKTIPLFSQWEKDTYSHCLTKTKWILSWAFQSMISAMFCHCQLSNHKRRNKPEKNNLWKTIGSAWVLIRVVNQNPAFFFCAP